MKFHRFLCCAIIAFLATATSYSQTKTTARDSIVKDTVSPLRYTFKSSQQGSLFLNKPSSIEVRFDKGLNKYIIQEKIGSYKIGNPKYLSLKEYQEYRLKNDVKSYFKNKIDALNSKKKGVDDVQKNLLPTYYVNSKFFESVFGSNSVEVTPTGSISLKFGGIYQNVDNPQISENNRSSFTFDFDQQITASITAKIGERLKVTADYDTQASFDFQNLFKLEYTPTEDDIIRKIEAGNISMPIKNSLINGAQSLFGAKTELQFGKTKVTAVISQQNSESKNIVSETGGYITPFELRATDYDDNRHFFLAQYFRTQYKTALQNYPLISSPIKITRLEVWVTNKNANTENFRNIVAFADLGESEPNEFVNSNINPTSPPTVLGKNIPANEANELSSFLVLNSPIRDISTVDDALSSSFNMKQGTDYSVLQNARKLNESEYTFNSQLGFISLNRKLNEGEVLAVAYEYTVVGSDKSSYKVGEFTNDGIVAPENLAVKLLRSEIITTKRTVAGVEEQFPLWKLMMKNVYALGVFPINPNGFRFEVLYRDDLTGISTNTLQNASTPDINTKPLLKVLNLDQLNQSLITVPNGDGFFDFVENITVNSSKGFVIFPDTEPFGTGLKSVLTTASDQSSYVFSELYSNTKAQAKNNFQNKDKFLLKGYAKTENNGSISLNAFNVPQGSVKVTAGGRQLVEGMDYTVDYRFGKVQIIDAGLQASGIPINVSTENNAVFNQQRKTFLGLDIEHQFSDEFIVGATVVNVNERPVTQKANYGQDPINNTMFGLNVDYATEVPLFTRLANKLPFVSTDVPSNLSIRADMAYLLPGTPSGIDVNGQATTYVDDFEASQIPIDLLSPLSWFTASTPDTPTFPNFNGDKKNDLSYNNQRAKLSWYSVDQIFYGNGAKPANIDNVELSRSEVRQIGYAELFPNTDLDITQNTLVRTLDLAYFPSERGTYNMDDTNANGTVLNNPETRWGGIMRPLTTNNFDQANVEYIQFWIKDPYQDYSITNEEGLPIGIDPKNPLNQVGDLYFNLGNISEDILKDNRKMYENGLPTDGSTRNTIPTNWGNIPLNQSIVYAFDENDLSRKNQDIGLDGIKNEDEAAFFSNLGINIANLNPKDIASDNFQYFRGSDLDAKNATILTRYKNFNNTEGNSPTANQSLEPYPTSASSYPDTEDINKDQTMNTVESYFEYKISLDKNNLVKGVNNIVDEKETTVTLPDGSSRRTKWYQFRIPVRSGVPINGITDFNSIRFIRMYLTKFKMPVVLRFGQLELVRSDYRRYTKTLDPSVSPQKELTQQQVNDFEVGVVNIEQNEGRYVVPPGIIREQLQGTSTIQQQNEQSVSIKVSNLGPNEIRAIYKNVSVDLRMYKELQMFLHAEPLVTGSIADDDLVAIVRLGTDLDENFYQLEIPLKISQNGSLVPTSVWPEANNLQATLEKLGQLKLQRDANILNSGGAVAVNKLYPFPSGSDPKELILRVKGNPTLASVRTLMLGVKNSATTAKSAEIWFNELRAAGFDNQGGWAAVISADTNFADVIDLSLTGKVQTMGFGNVEDRVNQRSIEEVKQYDFSTNIKLGKMLPQHWGIQLPLSYSIGEEFKDPKYDPQYQDVKFADAKDSNPNSINAQDYTIRKSVSFINVKKKKNPKSTKKPKFYDVENLSFSYAFSEEFHKDYTIEKYLNKNLTTSASYNFQIQSKFLEPFKNSKMFAKSKYFQFIKDINLKLLPTSFGVNSRITRSFNQQKSRNLIEGLSSQPTLTQRKFLFDWDYTVAFDLTKSLELNFNANNNYINDVLDFKEDDGIYTGFFNIGRPNHYNQNLKATYKLPLDKFPFLGFVNSQYSYNATFDWQASSQTYQDKIGNLLQNSNTHNFNSKFNFTKLYQDLGLKKLFVRAPKPKKPTINSNPRLPSIRKATIDDVAPPETFKDKFLLGMYNFLTIVKTGQLSYASNNGTLLPGYTGTAGFLGTDQINGGLAPSLGFVFGSQVDIRNTALSKGWLVAPRNQNTGEYYNKTYSNTSYNKFDLSVSIQPIKDLTVELFGNKIRTKNISQQLDIIDDGSTFGALAETPLFESGNFSTSYSMLSTVFKDSDVLFQNLLNNRTEIAQRLSDQSGLPLNGFKESGQQVLLPAFVAAYSGESSSKVGLGVFKNLPIPNWTFRYRGLMNLDWFKDNFSSFVISNGYKSSYTVANYTNNLQFDASKPTQVNASGNYQPELLVSSLSLIDEFSPLIKIDVKMRNSFSFVGEIRRDRTLTLNFDNSTLTDVKGTEFIVGLGYKISNVGFRTNFIGKNQQLRGDINLRANLSIRDNLTMIRSLDVENNQISGGQKLLSIKFAADYKLNTSLTASFYYNHNTSKYAISTTFPRQTINAGLNIIYNLGN
ncbi:cell surface protein SprA [Polaribacter pacificus]|uniref:Cell surface protein SprA n=1 Tax=Polaribacter pacificus TaxID=1775173 RepID=A0A917HXM0_9FLAO|nr:cell surface protein SprA [Polaribacter pacificus]GGG94355.1 cell surface protein SprA [Polaribacter pacificus]